jgi:hypothetical protein
MSRGYSVAGGVRIPVQTMIGILRSYEMTQAGSERAAGRDV